MAEGLRLVVSADTKQAEKEIKDFVLESQHQAQIAGTAIGKGLNKAIPAIKNIPIAAKPAIKAISHLGESIETLEAKIAARKEFIRVAKTTTDIVILRGEIIELEKELKRVQSIGVPVFNNVSAAVKKTGFSFNTIVSGANNAFGVIRKLAFILPGIGIAGIFGAIFGLFSSGAKEAEEKVEKLNDATDAASEKQKEFQSAVKKAADSVVDQAAKLQDLRKILLSTSDATSVLTNTTIKQGVARALFDQKNVALQGLVNAAIQKEILLRKQANPFSEVKSFRVNPEIEALDKQIKLMQDLGQNTDLLRKRRNELAQIKQLEFTSEDDIQGINQLSEGLEGFFKQFLDEKDKTKKGVDDVIAQAKRLASFLDKNTQFEVHFEVDETKSEEENKKAARAFIEKAKRFVEQQTPEFKFKPLLFAEFDVKFDKRIIENIRQQAGFEATKTFKQAKEAFEANIKRLAESDPLVIRTTAQIKAGIDQEQLRAQALASGSGIKLPDIGPLGTSVLTDMDKQALAAAQTLTGVLTPAFQGLFSAIKAGENPLKAFFDGIGQAVEQLIQKLIAAAVQALILSAIFPGGVGGVKGFGSIFKNILGFASGGIVSGPTLAMIGEGSGTSRSNPEIVAPLDQLRGILAGLAPQQENNGILTARIAGNDILLSNNRSNRRNGRLGA
jgi:hypothetical protein